MKLLCLNTWGGRIAEPLRKFLLEKKDKIDIFCFQEIFKGGQNEYQEDLTNINDANTSLYENISNILDSHVGFFCPVYKDIYGLAIFVKKDLEVIEKGEKVLFENKNFPNKDEPDADHTRKIQWLKIKSKNSIFTILNIHGHWVSGDKLDNAGRIRQSEIIVETLKSMPGPNILCGDFNLNPETESIKMIDKEIKNLIKEYNISSTRTNLYTKDEKYADYVFVSSEIKINDFKILEDVVSDHTPILLDFDIAQIASN